MATVEARGELVDPASDLVADLAHLFERLADRVGKRPVEVLATGQMRADVPTPHGH
ncbi:MAG: hypothetical protein H0X21_02175, partial [Actinobacteria bacterium]|nr:hypothetical protein [Actinomycetota bacterium]